MTARIAAIGNLDQGLGILSLANEAPSNIKPTGMVMAPIKVAVSSKKDSGGLPSGPFGILVPVQPSTTTKSDLRGVTRAMGRARKRDMLTGLRTLQMVARTTSQIGLGGV